MGADAGRAEGDRAAEGGTRQLAAGVLAAPGPGRRRPGKGVARQGTGPPAAIAGERMGEGGAARAAEARARMEAGTGAAAKGEHAAARAGP